MNEIIFVMKNSLDKFIRGSSHCFDLAIHIIFDLINNEKNQVLLLMENLLQKKLNM